MPRTTIKIAAAAVLVALAAAACGGSGENGPGDEETTVAQSPPAADAPFPEHDCSEEIPPGHTAFEEIDAILPSLEEVPDSFEIAECVRSLAQLSHLVQTEAAQGHLRESSVPENAQTGVARSFFHPKGWPNGGGWTTAFIMADETAAADALELIRSALVETAPGDPLEPVREIPAEGLGDGSFGIRGSFEPTYRNWDNVAYVWHRGNLMLAVRGWRKNGEPDSAPQEELLELARVIDARAA